MHRTPPILLCLLALTACNDDDGDGGGGGIELVEYQGVQSGEIVVDLASGAVTVPLQPQAFLISGTAVYDDAADAVTLSLTLRNRSTSILASTKLLIDALSEGAVAGDGELGAAAVPFVAYGPESLLPDTSATRTFEVAGVTGAASELSLDVTIAQHGWIFLPGDFDLAVAVDRSGAGLELVVDGMDLSFQSTDVRFDPVHVSDDGRHVYFACRNQPALARLDLATLDLVLGEPLIPGTIAFDASGVVGYVEAVTPSPDGELLYAVVHEGSHRYRFSLNYPPPAVRLFKLDADTLLVQASLEVAPSMVIPTSAEGGAAYVEYRGRELSITADGTEGALAITGLGVVHHVDLTGDMALFDHDPVQGGFQGFDVSATSTEVRRAAISPDGARIYVAYAGPIADANDGSLDVIDVAAGTILPEFPPSLSGAFNAPTVLAFGPDGRLYYGRAKDATTGLSIFDPVGLVWIQLAEPSDVSAIAFGDGVYHVHDDVNQAVFTYDLATDAPLLTEDGGASIPVGSGATGHGMVLVPAVGAGAALP